VVYRTGKSLVMKKGGWFACVVIVSYVLSVEGHKTQKF
jgi:hypothetical protein